jgi:hypothetical protein
MLSCEPVSHVCTWCLEWLYGWTASFLILYLQKTLSLSLPQISINLCSGIWILRPRAGYSLCISLSQLNAHFVQLHSQHFLDNGKESIWGMGFALFLRQQLHRVALILHTLTFGDSVTAWKWWSKVAGSEVCWDYRPALHTWSQWIISTSTKSTKFWWWDIAATCSTHW